MSLLSLIFAVSLVATAATVKPGAGAALRAGACDEDAPLVETLPSGTLVELRSSIAGGSTGACYRVSVRLADGRVLNGNMAGSELQGVEEFDQARRGALAGSGDSVQLMVTTKQVDSLRGTLAARETGNKPKQALPGGTGPVPEAMRLLDANQPTRALEILAPHIPQGHPDVLVLAGIAAWKTDQVKLALDHWKAAQSIRPVAELNSLIERLENENRHDRSNEKLIGLRVSLRYENQALPYATAKALTDVLDAEYARISSMLGCNTSDERLIAILQSPQDYRQSSNAAEWSGGQFDGSRIRVPIPSGAVVDEQLRRVMAHEVTHACLAKLGDWPVWLQEGLAQKLSGERLSGPARDSLLELAARKQLPRLQDFRRNWSALDGPTARISYAVALAAADDLVDRHGASIGLRTILATPSLLDRITSEINRHLGLE